MADATTTTYNFTKPESGASDDTWGTKLNANWDSVDDVLDGTTVMQGAKLDSAISIVDATDNTKAVQFAVSGITTATTRTVTMPDTDVTLQSVGTSDAVQFGSQKVVGTATGQTAGTDADELVIDNTVASGMSFLTAATATSKIAFGDTVDADVGYISYAHTGDTLTLNAETDITMSVAGNTIATFDSGSLVMSKMIHRAENTSNLQIAGGNAAGTGGHIKLYGGEASYPDRVEVNADIIQFENQSGTTWGRMELADIRWGQTSTSTPGVGNTTTGLSLNDGGRIFASTASTAPIAMNRNDGDGNIITGYIAGTLEGRITNTAASGMAFNNPSDRRLKENIAPADDTGALFDSLDIVSFDWKDRAEKGGSRADRRRWGVIAQDVLPHLPEAVYRGSEDMSDPWGVRSTEFIYPLVQEVKSLRSRVSDLEARLEALEAKK